MTAKPKKGYLMKRKTMRTLQIFTLALLLLILGGLLLYFNRTAITLFFTQAKKEPISLTETDIEIIYRFRESLQSEGAQFDQSLMLINLDHPLPVDFVPELGEYRTSGVTMNTAIHTAYGALSDYIKAEMGQKLYVSSAFRTGEEQAALYREDPTIATKPGASEHQSGLCLDVYIAYHAGDAFYDSAVGRYVNEHASDYGFVIRYPAWGEKETGIRFEPWHIRYVGLIHAKIMTGNRLTLEAYIEALTPGTVYYATHGGKTYAILRAAPDNKGKIATPKGEGKLTISPDNTGCYIVTREMQKVG